MRARKTNGVYWLPRASNKAIREMDKKYKRLNKTELKWVERTESTATVVVEQTPAIE